MYSVVNVSRAAFALWLCLCWFPFSFGPFRIKFSELSEFLAAYIIFLSSWAWPAKRGREYVTSKQHGCLRKACSADREGRHYAPRTVRTNSNENTFTLNARCRTQTGGSEHFAFVDRHDQTTVSFGYSLPLQPSFIEEKYASEPREAKLSSVFSLQSAGKLFSFKSRYLCVLNSLSNSIRRANFKKTHVTTAENE